MNTYELATRRVKLKKVSNTNGGEWQGPCPGCGGKDRFHVWPNENDGEGSFWCRVCGKGGDRIQFLRDFEGLSFHDACAELHITLADRSHVQFPTQDIQQDKPAFQPAVHTSPGDLWQEEAEMFVPWAQKNLANNAEVLSWLAQRGISVETAKNYRLGWNTGENGGDIKRSRKTWGLEEIKADDGRPKALWIPRGLVIPYINERVIYRIKIRRLMGEPRYYVLPGSSMATMILEQDRPALVVVESELDAIAIVAANNLAGAVALGSASAKPDAEASTLLQGSSQILNALDYDVAGAKALTWWAKNFKNCFRWPVPRGKDPGEAIQLGTDLRQWIRAGLAPALTDN